ncbi:MAG: thioredoxin-dependent thiol peroxidase [Chloroflexi bacterium]|nr:MAG: thioredoxin-dependent thiol peroxidase [Chloroflexota bacterium]
MPVTLETGDAAPKFKLPDQDGQQHSLADYRGQIVVLYFYPKDETPGCVKEACSFRDEFIDIKAEGAVVLGLSADSAASHRAFREHHQLPFPLLVDEGAKVATSYGSWGEKVLYGRRSIGMTRSTFIIGPDGKLLRVWKRATAADHGAKVLQALRDLKKAAGRGKA